LTLYDSSSNYCGWMAWFLYDYGIPEATYLTSW
jgi:hypothetical protein